ncbi:haloalkane dehalogenase [Sphingopyxis sp. Root1497]|uniref:haloalkane dehalogenase n=1 Tax=Sphingopyxis sp. Root1497 TaxID=1736474 RepID=UPI0006FFD006|nr:haloalkane dehalogenase [Sphingopyxis sp. Root1497]KQZ61017.1 haloalkane dehalogenase [Sphingopyxis sp. Root1497]
MTREKAKEREQPFAQKKFMDVGGHRMAYIDEGDGPAILFQHGNPTSSYLWRNILPHLAGLGRLIAPDLMGMGDSDKLPVEAGRHRYGFTEQRRYFNRLLDALDVGHEVILVLHDMGSMLGFAWAKRNADRVRGIAYMESVVSPLLITDFPEAARQPLLDVFSTLEGQEASLQTLDFLDGFLLGTREFSETEQAYYRKPFLIAGEDRRPMISSDLPVNGVPGDTAAIVADYAQWMAENDIPKLMVKADPGFLLIGRLHDFARTWRNQTEVTIAGTHFIQETSPDAIGIALADFVRGLAPGARERC